MEAFETSSPLRKSFAPNEFSQLRFLIVTNSFGLMFSSLSTEVSILRLLPPIGPLTPFKAILTCNLKHGFKKLISNRFSTNNICDDPNNIPFPKWLTYIGVNDMRHFLFGF